MTRQKAGRKFYDYCKKHNVDIILSIFDDVPFYFAEYSAENAPNHVIKSIVDFDENEITLSVYFSEMGARVVRESKNKDGLLWLLNCLNNHLIFKDKNSDPAHPRLLYAPRFFLDDEEGIMLTTVIPYVLFEAFSEQTAFYITSFCPQLLDAVALDLFLTAFGEIDSDRALENIKNMLSY